MMSQLKTPDLHRDLLSECVVLHSIVASNIHELYTKTTAARFFSFLHFLKNNNLKKKQITDRKHLNDRIFKRDLVSTNIALLGHIIEEL